MHASRSSGTLPDDDTNTFSFLTSRGGTPNLLVTSTDHARRAPVGNGWLKFRAPSSPAHFRDFYLEIALGLFPAHAATATGFDTTAWALYPSRAYLPAKVRVTIDFLRAALAA